MKMQHAMFLFMCSSIAVADVLNTTPSTKIRYGGVVFPRNVASCLLKILHPYSFDFIEYIPSVNDVIQEMFDPDELEDQIEVELGNFLTLYQRLRKLQRNLLNQAGGSSHRDDVRGGVTEIDASFLNEMVTILERRSRPGVEIIPQRWGLEAQVCQRSLIDVEMIRALGDDLREPEQEERKPDSQNEEKLKETIKKLQRKFSDQVRDLRRLARRLNEVTY